MPKYQTPTKKGWFWAKLIHPSGIPEGQLVEDYASADWEVVEVFVNCLNEDDPEHLGVFVGGLMHVQWIEDFVWGPEVVRPQELSK